MPHLVVRDPGRVTVSVELRGELSVGRDEDNDAIEIFKGVPYTPTGSSFLTQWQAIGEPQSGQTNDGDGFGSSVAVGRGALPGHPALRVSLSRMFDGTIAP